MSSLAVFATLLILPLLSNTIDDTVVKSPYIKIIVLLIYIMVFLIIFKHLKIKLRVI